MVTEVDHVMACGEEEAVVSSFYRCFNISRKRRWQVRSSQEVLDGRKDLNGARGVGTTHFSGECEYSRATIRVVHTVL